MTDAKPVVGVIGLGYVGLPLLLAFREAGCAVIGIDNDETKISRLAAGRSYLSHLPDERVAILCDGQAALSTDPGILVGASDIIIAVPTPLTDVMTPDLSFVEATARAVGQHLQPDQLVSLESTTYPGTTREVVQPLLEEASGLTAGEDFFLAFSPERVDPGDDDHDITRIPKIVAGLGPADRDRAVALYALITPETVPVASPETAEMAKLLENIYRAVNIALVNELKMLADRMDLDIWEVIAAAATKPFGFQAFWPGPGLGGHCLPIDPFYLDWIARTRYGFETRFVELAGKINTGMPAWVVEKTAAALREDGRDLSGAAILIVGVAYKKDISDTRESPGLALMDLCRAAGAARVDYHDPFVPTLPPTRAYPEFTGLNAVALTPETVAGYDAVIIAADHTALDYALLAEHASLVVDTRNAMRGLSPARARIVRA